MLSIREGMAVSLSSCSERHGVELTLHIIIKNPSLKYFDLGAVVLLGELVELGNGWWLILKLFHNAIDP
jgi:hypothetical protein